MSGEPDAGDSSPQASAIQWNSSTRIAFRFAFCYCVLYCLYMWDALHVRYVFLTTKWNHFRVRRYTQRYQQRVSQLLCHFVGAERSAFSIRSRVFAKFAFTRGSQFGHVAASRSVLLSTCIVGSAPFCRSKVTRSTCPLIAAQ